MVRGTARDGSIATRAGSSGRAKQSEFRETPTGSDGRGPLHDSEEFSCSYFPCCCRSERFLVESKPSGRRGTLVDRHGSGETAVRGPIWPTEFIGDLAGKLLPVGRWKRQPVDALANRMTMVFRSWFLAVQILVRERLDALGEELKSPTGNRPVTLATVRKHQLVEATVTQLSRSRDRAGRETVGQRRLALREL